jgi:hypothetical protein
VAHALSRPISALIGTRTHDYVVEAHGMPWVCVIGNQEFAMGLRAFLSLAILACCLVSGCSNSPSNGSSDDKPLFEPKDHPDLADDEKEPVAEIEKVGGEVEIDSGRVAEVHLSGITDKGRVNAALAHTAKLNSVRKLYLDTAAVDDGTLELVGEITSLEELNLDGTQVTDAGLRHLHGLKNLKLIFLRRTKVTKIAGDKLREAINAEDAPDTLRVTYDNL